MPPERVGVDLPVLLVQGRRGGGRGGSALPGGGGRLLMQVLVAVVDPVRVEVHGGDFNQCSQAPVVKWLLLLLLLWPEA